jgi:hypothetical protein
MDLKKKILPRSHTKHHEEGQTVGNSFFVLQRAGFVERLSLFLKAIEPGASAASA